MLLFAAPVAAVHTRRTNALPARCTRIRYRKAPLACAASAAPGAPEPWLADMAAYTEKYSKSISDADTFWSEIGSEFEWADNAKPRASPAARLSPPGVS
eukprot:IDg11323t1